MLTGCGISSLRRGYDGSCGLMPLKAFAVASLFVGSAAAASVSALHASGIHKVPDHLSPFHSRFLFISAANEENKFRPRVLRMVKFPSQVEDFVQAGANLRARLGIPSRPHHHKRK
ncbi:unnamed protein product [Linum tenue]|uniref:Uncharacterized protein n=1 Tax=Linum tenue TaxID=586396 RepID=A0AAV0M9L1_9ROSI|nr:unnamed protein product [Linum tenue]